MQGTLRAAWAMYSERSMSPRVSDNVGGPLPSVIPGWAWNHQQVAHFAQTSSMRLTLIKITLSGNFRIWLDNVQQNIKKVKLVCRQTLIYFTKWIVNTITNSLDDFWCITFVKQLTFRNVEWIRISCCHKRCHKELRFKDLETTKLYNNKSALKLVCKPSYVWSKCAVWDFIAQRVISITPVPTWATRVTRIEQALPASDFRNNKQMEMHRSVLRGRAQRRNRSGRWRQLLKFQISLECTTALTPTVSCT